MFDDATRAAVRKHADKLKIEPAALFAVIEVESAGKVTATVDGRQEPLIRFEGHYFDRRLKNGKRALARQAGLANPKAGKVKNPKSQAARWKLLGRAAAIDRQAAYESVSWGVGQVMGAHWDWLGFKSVDALVALCRRDAAGQIDLMVRYIVKAGLVGALQRRDFNEFARGYNGPAYAEYGYHTKMAQAYRRWSNGAEPVSKAEGMLRMGSKGARVRELQALLTRAGYPVTVDGDFGPATRDALMDFQREQHIRIDGVAGPETIRAIEEFRQAPDEQPGALPVDKIPEVKEGVGGLAGGAALETVSTQVEQAADKVSWLPGLEWLSATLTTIAVLLVLGGLAWAAYGWWKSRRTDEGDVGGPGLMERLSGFFRRRQEEVMP